MSRHDDGWKEGPSDPEESTRRLFWRARDGDDDARDRLFRRLLPRIKRWAHGRMPRGARGMEDTEDLTQHVALLFHQAMERFEPRDGASFGAYLRTTILNWVRTKARGLACRPGPGETATDLPALGPSPFEEALEHEMLELYEAALEKLSADEQALINHRIELGLPFADIARLLHKPSEDAARVATTRAIGRLGQEIRKARRGREVRV